jgi:hypothetical protein
MTNDAQANEAATGEPTNAAENTTNENQQSDNINDMWRGQMPPKIDEGIEPEHDDILPT